MGCRTPQITALGVVRSDWTDGRRSATSSPTGGAPRVPLCAPTSGSASGCGWVLPWDSARDEVRTWRGCFLGRWPQSAPDPRPGHPRPGHRPPAPDPPREPSSQAEVVLLRKDRTLGATCAPLPKALPSAFCWAFGLAVFRPSPGMLLFSRLFLSHLHVLHPVPTVVFCVALFRTPPQQKVSRRHESRVESGAPFSCCPPGGEPRSLLSAARFWQLQALGEGRAALPPSLAPAWPASAAAAPRLARGLFSPIASSWAFTVFPCGSDVFWGSDVTPKGTRLRSQTDFLAVFPARGAGLDGFWEGRCLAASALAVPRAERAPPSRVRAGGHTSLPGLLPKSPCV